MAAGTGVWARWSRVAALAVLAASAGGCAPAEPGEVDGLQAALRELDENEYEFFVLLNEHRAANGVPPVRPDRILNQVARDYAAFMGETDCFDHTECDGKQPWDRMCEGGYEPACRGDTPMGENIAAGQPTGRDVFESWRSSPGHNENMLRPEFRVVGIGRVEASGASYSPYWVNVFAGAPTEQTYEQGAAAPDGGYFEEDGGTGSTDRSRRGRGGCGCAAAPVRSADGLLGLFALALLAGRRRRGRPVLR